MWESLLLPHLHSTLIKYKVIDYTKSEKGEREIYIPLWLNIKQKATIFVGDLKSADLHSTLIKYKDISIMNGAFMLYPIYIPLWLNIKWNVQSQRRYISDKFTFHSD